ncbi:DNA-directed RNA polymerase subunit omega [Ichthyobacterium seriolicida]|uniref:RNA polymerase rpb6 n=1 Tax=Ichthyobacterium seriolicida TaxID=242600 RepID=A0A1J1DWM7_9FLAO|nr:DNA-directed RNA polymerase subunit omega [Ichthyobacterium seriolicida]BAV94273.1 RNA polymerase rpb6 [Ichthyobacterium seriolicida]
MEVYKKYSTNKVAFDQNKVDYQLDNIYESIVKISKRAKEISSEIEKDLKVRLGEFQYENEVIEEVFENREQIEVSKYYERLPKPTQIAAQEWVDAQESK